MRKALQALTDAGVIRYPTAGLKNVALACVRAYLVLAGARESVLVGFGPDGSLQRLLTRL
ncbi:MAG: hypothetical protein WBV18_02660 [Methyloceanibacter sp.]|uniref:hypothetical protein n=1 Tax=Methyloceanibacter sp. TaxID=1965321 RepID=UPI003C686ADE